MPAKSLQTGRFAAFSPKRAARKQGDECMKYRSGAPKEHGLTILVHSCKAAMHEPAARC